MRTLRDFEGRSIRLTTERLNHILEHPEMRGMINSIGETLSSPQKVIESVSDVESRLYYRFYIGTKVGDKYLCVVVKIGSRDAFVITSYLTNAIKKKGKLIWPRNL